MTKLEDEVKDVGSPLKMLIEPLKCLVPIYGDFHLFKIVGRWPNKKSEKIAFLTLFEATKYGYYFFIAYHFTKFLVN